MSNEVEFNSLTGNDEVKVKLEQPSSQIPQKPSEEEVAKYSKTRMVLVVFFSLIIIAMVVAAVIIIIVSPKCSKAKEVNKEWFKGKIVYQIYPRSFKDSDGNGNGDLKGIIEKLDYLKELGVEILLLDTLYDDDFKNISSMYGKLSDFEDLVDKAKDKDIKVVFNFIPNYTSDEHKWFLDSKAKVNASKRGWYVWRPDANNWISVKDGSAWEKDATTNEFYLHQFEKSQPDLNLRNESVVEELNNVLKFWADKGVEGFRAGFVQYMLEDKTFRDEIEKSNYKANASVLTYDMVEHNQTFDLPGNLDIVKKFRSTLDKSDTHKLLILDVKGKDINKFYAQSDLPTFTGLITDVLNADIARSINKTVSNYLASVPKDNSPSFAIGNPTSSRVGDRLGENLIDAMNVLLLTLPGNPVTYYGEEIGMIDSTGSSKSPMQWNSKKEAGFTTGASWTAVSSNKDKINVEDEKKDEKSHYAVYKAVAELREDSAFKSSDFKVVQVDSKVFSYTRGNKYLVVINFSAAKWDGDFKGISGRGTVSFDSKFSLKGQTVDVNKISLEGGQAVVVKLDNPQYI